MCRKCHAHQYGAPAEVLAALVLMLARMDCPAVPGDANVDDIPGGSEI